MRSILSLVAGAFLAALGALILGEYEFDWVMAVAGGILFGVVVAEVVVAVAGRGSAVAAAGSSLLSASGLAWAAWISSGQGLEPFPRLAWLAMGLAVGAAAVRARPPSGVTG